MRKLLLILPSFLFFLWGCNNVVRVEVEVLRPPRLNVNIKKLSLRVVQKKLKNEFVEIQDFKGEVTRFIKNELETEANIKVVDEKNVPVLKVEYSASLSKAYTFYNPKEVTEGASEDGTNFYHTTGTMVPVKIVSMNMCFIIERFKYKRCMKERMHFQAYESSVFALYSILQRMTSSFLADIAYQQKKVMHYLLR